MRRVDPTVALAVAKVKDEADEQPYNQSHPICPAESIDHRATGDDAENRDERRGGNAESPFELGMLHAHDPDTGANETEREQRADAGHFTGHVGGHECRE